MDIDESARNEHPKIIFLNDVDDDDDDDDDNEFSRRQIFIIGL